MRLSPPDLNSRRSRFADWLELTALRSATGQAPISAVRKLIRIAADDRVSAKDFDSDADDVGEAEVTDRASDDLEERVMEELQFRLKTVGDSYPFELQDRRGQAFILSRKASWEVPQTGELFYVFCLLDSAIRDSLLSVAASERSLVHQIGNVFQICACIAVGGYTDAEVVSFGFPRATGDSFLPALQAVWRRHGSYTIRAAIPHGFDDKLKDGGIDIIAWRPFDDGHAAGLLMLVQVASGLNWKDKEVAGDVRSLKQWFEGAHFEHFLPAICIPFPLWFDLDEPPKDVSGGKTDFGQGVLARFVFREAKFGVIFDRGRIARCCARALGATGGPSPGIDGVGRIGDVLKWVRDVMSVLAETREAA